MLYRHRFAMTGKLNFKMHTPKRCADEQVPGGHKTKLIAKRNIKSCQCRCNHHRFSIRKIDNGQQRKPFTSQDDEIYYNFCPNYDIVNDHIEGGFPQYNNDYCSNTPAFIKKYKGFNERDRLLYTYKINNILAKANQQTKNCSEKTRPVNINFEKKDENAMTNEIISQFRLILLKISAQ